MNAAQKLVRVERQRAIRAPQQRVYQLLSRVEGHPRFADLWLAADVLEHGGGQVVAEFRGYFAGLPVDSVQRLMLRPPARLEFRQLRGTLKALRGEYLIERDGAGARLTARMEVEAGIPLLDEEAVRTVLTTALTRLVGKVKDAAERDLPRLVARRPGAAAPGAALSRVPLDGEEGPPEEALEAPGEGEEAPRPDLEPPETSTTAPSPPGTLPASERAGERRSGTERPVRRRRRRRHRRRRGLEGGGGAP